MQKQNQPDTVFDALKINLPTPELSAQYCHTFSQWLFDNYGNDNVLMATIHGSYLYGIAHKESDIDCYVVTLHGENTQKEFITDNGYVIDIRCNSLERYVELLGYGAHQAVEAFFSPYAVWNKDSVWYPYLSSQRINLAKFAKKCLSAAESFRERAQLLPDKEEKLLSHATRLEHKVECVLDNNGAYSPIYKKFHETSSKIVQGNSQY